MRGMADTDKKDEIDDVKKPKPDPELFQKAAVSLGVKSNEALVFEDSLNGLRAAKTAGRSVGVIPNPVTRHSNFQGATLQLESLGEHSLSELLSRL